MTKNEFLKEYIVESKILIANYEMHGDHRKRAYALMANGRLVPIRLIKALRRLFPRDTEVLTPFPIFESDTVLEFRYKGGSVTFKGLGIPVHE